MGDTMKDGIELPKVFPNFHSKRPREAPRELVLSVGVFMRTFVRKVAVLPLSALKYLLSR